MRSRPRLDSWNLACTFNYNRDVGVQPDVIQLAATNAGLTVGVGDYRIANKGWYGSFTVKELEVIDPQGEITHYYSVDADKVLADAGV